MSGRNSKNPSRSSSNTSNTSQGSWERHPRAYPPPPPKHSLPPPLIPTKVGTPSPRMSPALDGSPPKNLPPPLIPTPVRTPSLTMQLPAPLIPTPVRTPSPSVRPPSPAPAKGPAPPPPQPGLVWPNQYYIEKVVRPERLQAIKYEEKLLIVAVYYTDWSAECKQNCKHIEKIASEFPHVKFVKVDTDFTPQIGTAEGIQALPTLAYYMDGEKLAETVGPIFHDIYEKLEQLQWWNRKPGLQLPEGGPPTGPPRFGGRFERARSSTTSQSSTLTTSSDSDSESDSSQYRRF